MGVGYVWSSQFAQQEAAIGQEGEWPVFRGPIASVIRANLNWRFGISRTINKIGSLYNRFGALEIGDGVHGR
jgi:hypothetical protein